MSTTNDVRSVSSMGDAPRRGGLALPPAVRDAQPLLCATKRLATSRPCPPTAFLTTSNRFSNHFGNPPLAPAKPRGRGSPPRPLCLVRETMPVSAWSMTQGKSIVSTGFVCLPEGPNLMHCLRAAHMPVGVHLCLRAEAPIPRPLPGGVLAPRVRCVLLLRVHPKCPDFHPLPKTHWPQKVYPFPGGVVQSMEVVEGSMFIITEI